MGTGAQSGSREFTGDEADDVQAKEGFREGKRTAFSRRADMARLTSDEAGALLLKVMSAKCEE
jgi:hypothetical protein